MTNKQALYLAGAATVLAVSLTGAVLVPNEMNTFIVGLACGMCFHALVHHALVTIPTRRNCDNALRLCDEADETFNALIAEIDALREAQDGGKDGDNGS